MKRTDQVIITDRKMWKDYVLLSFKSPQIASKALPGQFLMIRITPHSYPLLRRPISIHAVEGENIAIFFQKSGIGTNILGLRKKKELLDILGPLGNGFGLKGDFSHKKTVLIGGGRGIAPLFFLANSLADRKAEIRTFYGGKTSHDLPLKEKFEANGLKVFCSTEDGSFGYKGLITDYFNSEMRQFRPERIYACGPDAMLKTIADIAAKENIPAELSLESIMGCGIGACWGCVKRLKKDGVTGWFRICQEGPVIPADQIIWAEKDK